MKIALLTPSMPNQVGHGGTHRAYQIFHDLTEAYGQDSVYVLTASELTPLLPKPASLPAIYLDKAIRASYRLARNPIYWTIPKHQPVISTPWASRRALAYYRSWLRDNHIQICIIEHSHFREFARINAEFGVPTIVCPANIESLDQLPSGAGGQLAQSVALELSREIEFFRSCDARFFISKVEAGLVNGLGIPSTYYPYIPVGDIANFCVGVRQARRTRNQKRIFLMLGSAVHATTGYSFKWLLEGLTRLGIPDDIEIVVGGNGTDSYRELIPALPANVKCVGWLDQQHLEDLLITCSAVLVPQLFGFGALTRLPELELMGVPVLVSRHAAFALDVPENFVILKDDVAQWHTAMLRTVNNIRIQQLPLSERRSDQQNEPSALIQALHRFIR